MDRLHKGPAVGPGFSSFDQKLHNRVDQSELKEDKKQNPQSSQVFPGGNGFSLLLHKAR